MKSTDAGQIFYLNLIWRGDSLYGYSDQCPPSKIMRQHASKRTTEISHLRSHPTNVLDN